MNVGMYLEQQLKRVGNQMYAEGRSRDYVRGFIRGMRFLSETLNSIQEQERQERSERIAEKLKNTNFTVLLGRERE